MCITILVKPKHNHRNTRLEKLEKIIWEIGLPIPPHIESYLDEKDKKYIEDYHRLITKHSNLQSLKVIDLFKDYTPPKDLYIEVRAREDIEEVKTKLGGKIKIKF